MNQNSKLCLYIIRNSFVFLTDHVGTRTFLEAGFPCKDKEWIQTADWYRKQFEVFWNQIMMKRQNSRNGRNFRLQDCVCHSFAFSRPCTA